MDECLLERVRQFICKFWSMRPDKLLLDTRLEDDLGMTELDAAEFLEEFAKEFEVDLSGIDFHKHFGPECAFVPGWLKHEMETRGYGNYPVTIGHLIEVASARRWSCPPPSGLWDQELDG
jgi:hypothetical protein